MQQWVPAPTSLLDALTLLTAVVAALSVAAERLVEIVKGLVPFLNQPQVDPKREGWRRSALQFLAVVAGIVTAFLAKPALTGVVPAAWTQPPALLALGLLTSGGSGLWNALLTYFKYLKDIKKALAELQYLEVQARRQQRREAAFGG